jgi:Cu-Zn family superoxide dismutase
VRPDRHVEANAFHGFHIHANDNPANGRGCVADPSDLRSTWFVSADGHLGASNLIHHGKHSGDLPNPLAMADGTARLTFSTDRITPEVLRGKAVILHDKPDNFGNIPPTDCTANTEAATERTAATGNAGDPLPAGCSVAPIDPCVDCRRSRSRPTPGLQPASVPTTASTDGSGLHQTNLADQDEGPGLSRFSAEAGSAAQNSACSPAS